MGKEGYMCVRITFTRKPSFFKVSPCFDGQLECESWEPMQVDPGAWQAAPSGDAAPSSHGLLPACTCSGLLRVWSLDDLHRNHLGCQFKKQIPRIHPRPKDSHILGRGLGLFSLKKHRRRFLRPLGFESMTLALQSTVTAQYNF